MIKRHYRTLLYSALILIALIPGGGQDRNDLEDLSLLFLYGMDLDPNNRPIFYLDTPVFHKEAEEKTEKHRLAAESARASRVRFDQLTVGNVSGGKLQVLLLGKRLLETPDWFPMLDVFYRDPKNSVNAIVVAVDGDMSEVVNLKPADKPRLSLYLVKKINTVEKRNITTRTTLQQLHRQMYEKGMTPSVTIIRKKGDQIEISGMALMEENGKYTTTLKPEEWGLVRILQNKAQKGVNLSVEIPSGQREDTPGSVKISFMAEPSSKIKVEHSEDRFRYRITLKLPVYLREVTGEMDLDSESNELEAQIKKQLEKKFQAVVQKMQSHKVDPAGFGLYARAYQYKKWKQVENEWGEAWAKAEVQWDIQVNIKAVGPVK